ncbi:MAG: ABC transporter ATP-binding protein [Verrucomicrobiota bacterium]
MNDTVISLENVSKQYRLGEIGTGSLAHDLNRWWSRVRGKEDPYLKIGEKNDRTRKGDSDYVWALQGVSFDVKQGDIVGIVGRNGAGKSTLLKILSRVTTPTTGEIRVKGRIASLLEVGTGFHPELTGRDNIFLNGAILGMRKNEIQRKFDEIVDFSGCERYIDTPVKRYSSGMYVRLAFAVAAHLEPEILVVDEVLAVGDASFQKKCISKMKDVAGEGRTILFVSHNMAAVNNLCSKGVYLKDGTMFYQGGIDDVVTKYLGDGKESTGELSWPDPAHAPGNERVRLTGVRIISDGEITSDIVLDKDITIEMDYEVLEGGLPYNASIHLLDKMGVEVLASANFAAANLGDDPWHGKPMPAGRFTSICIIPAFLLNESQYSIRFAIVSNIAHLEFLTSEIIGFQTHDTGQMRAEYTGHWLGVVRPKLLWETAKTD